MYISETKLRKIIREQLLPEFSLGWFVTRNTIHLTKLIFAEELPVTEDTLFKLEVNC